ncbi:hypothetical protein G7Z17_g4534 [Cylindrodendrum hubeiense]|uniref:Uncharacterized protein n=1 Tax=Cylindrodendrum hubeiense TaxID=595255 RepID=A0A9P5HIY2_9HYPO|nr:hypothetical protein G7Z17_g4534 [Cylindrodendrum hubeiense]
MNPQSTPTHEAESQENDATEYSSDSDGEVMIEKWHDVIKAIEMTTRDAFSNSPPFDSSPVAFRSYWYGIFTALHGEILSDPKIPKFLTAPAAENFTISLFDERGTGCCPCGLPDVSPNISLENDDGVTKGDLIYAFKEYMYGDSSPEIHAAFDSSTPKESIGALVYSSDWMSSGYGGRNGEKAVYNADEPNIVLYCCGPESFKENIQADEQPDKSVQQTEKQQQPKRESLL